MRISKIMAAVLAVAAAIWLLTSVPVEVPDTSTPLDTNHAGSAGGGNRVGQTLVPSRNGLDRIDVGIATQRSNDDADLTFQVMEVPWQQVRTIHRKLSELPVGNVTDFRPGTIRERWHSFNFEPIPDSAGKTMYFSFEGKSIQAPDSADLLMFFHNSYSLGEAYVNGEAVNGYVVFRTYTRGNVVEMMSVVLGNWAATIPAPIGHPTVMIGIVLLFVALAVATVRMVFTAERAPASTATSRSPQRG